MRFRVWLTTELKVSDLDARKDLDLITDSQDIRAVKEYLGSPSWFEYQSLFVKIVEGDYVEIYGCGDLAPRLTSWVDTIKWDLVPAYPSEAAPKKRGKFRDPETGKYPLYAFPGGYPIFYQMKDGGALCPECANDASNPVDEDPDDAQWVIVSAEINYEDEDLYCDHCNRKIESAYGEVEEEEKGGDKGDACPKCGSEDTEPSPASGGYFQCNQCGAEWSPGYLSIWDNGGKTADRYSVVTSETIGRGLYMILGLSDDCDSPGGVNMFSEGTPGPHLGREVLFRELPSKVQKCVKERLKEE
jgi:ribosomal protein L37AE/L43A